MKRAHKYPCGDTSCQQILCLKPQRCPCGIGPATHAHNQFSDTERLDWLLQRDLGVRDDYNIGGVLWLDTRRGIDAAMRKGEK